MNICTLKNLPVYCTKTLNHLKYWTTRNWNTVIANWFDKLEPIRIWGVSYNTRWILTAKLNIVEQVLKVSASICWLMKFYSCEYAAWHILYQTYEKHPIYVKISTCGCDLFNYLIIKKFTYTEWMCLKRSCIQCLCDWICHLHSVYVTDNNRVIITIIIIKV